MRHDRHHSQAPKVSPSIMAAFMRWRAPNFELRKGEHVAIMGDNGAGKSTFVRQMTAVEQRTSRQDHLQRRGGELQERRLKPARPASRRCSRTSRWPTISMCRRTCSSAARKSCFNLGPFSILDFKSMREATRRALEKTAVKIPNLSNTIRNMSGGQRQCVAIARTATFASKLIIMDEPTAALGVQETAQVENIIRTLKASGRAADPHLPQHAPGVRPGRPHRRLPPRPHRRQPDQE